MTFGVAMPRFFINSSAVFDDAGKKRAVIDGDDASHISRSLRMKPGDALTLCDACGVDYECEIAEITSSCVTLDIIEEKISLAEAPYKATVFQALVKGDRFDTVVQKSVEFGAASVVPLASSRCTVRLSGDDIKKKRVRWQRIAEEGAKQCGRGIIPRVEDGVDIKRAAEVFAEFDLVLFCYEKATRPLKDVLATFDRTPKSIAVVIGPEGGFDEAEAEIMEKIGAFSVSLGRRILRTESAAPFALACLSYAFEM